MHHARNDYLRHTQGGPVSVKTMFIPYVPKGDVPYSDLVESMHRTRICKTLLEMVLRKLNDPLHHHHRNTFNQD